MPPRLLFVLALIVFGALVGASSLVGLPENATGNRDLPGVALGWPLLFHVLRASALLGAVGTVLLVAWRGSQGDWPIKFGNVEYAPKQAVAITADALEKQDRRLRLVEARLGLDKAPIEPDS
jgi:hypothetical protein